MIRLIKESNNLYRLTIGDLWIYFSYETPIAFEIHGKTTATKNIWSSTTGKHLNLIDTDKSKRLNYPQFLEELEKAVKTV